MVKERRKVREENNETAKALLMATYWFSALLQLCSFVEESRESLDGIDGGGSNDNREAILYQMISCENEYVSGHIHIREKGRREDRDTKYRQIDTHRREIKRERESTDFIERVGVAAFFYGRDKALF